MRDSRTVAIAIMLVLVSAPVVGVMDLASAQSDTSYNRSQLERDGPHLANSPDGIRMSRTDEKMYWLVHWPANEPFADVGSTEGGDYLGSGETVGRNSVYLRTWQFETEEKTVHVVYWEKGQKEVEKGNTTTTEPVARNVTAVQHDVTFERGRPTTEIPLRQHDSRKQVTLWIEGEDYARWRFSHKSIATTQSTDISSEGDYLANVIVDFLLWILVGGFVVGFGTKKMIDRAGVGPQYGLFPWIAGLSILTGLGALLFFETIADLVVNAQYLLALYVVGVLGIVMLETRTEGLDSVLFLRPTLSHAKSPTGAEAFDVIDAEGREETIVRNGDTVSVVKPGLFAFLARVFGASARLVNVEKLRTRVPMQNSEWDELYLVDPEADEILYYAPERWTFDYPPLDRSHAFEWLFVASGVSLAAWSVSAGIASAVSVGALTLTGLCVWSLRPVDGKAAVRPAPIHLRTAFGTMIKYAQDVDDAKYLREVKDQLDSERITKQREIDKEVESHDRTLIEGMLDPEDKIPSGAGENENEITENQRENGKVPDKDSEVAADGGKNE